MVSTPERITYNSPISVVTSFITNNPSAENLLHQFYFQYDVKQKTAVWELYDVKKNINAIIKMKFIVFNYSKD